MAKKQTKKVNKPVIRYADEVEEWDLREDLGEKERAYYYFCLYRDMDLPLGMGAKRTLKRCAELADVSPTTIGNYYNKFQWKSRVRAYDIFREKQRRALHERELDKMYDAHAKIGSSVIAKAMRKLLDTPNDMLTINDVTKLLELGLKTERISRGETIEGKLKNAKLDAEIENLKSSDESSHVQILDDIPNELDEIDDIPDEKGDDS